MADAKQCDICGKYYSMYYMDSGRPSSHGHYIDGLQTMCYRNQITLECYDLCADCANDLIAFIRQHKKEEVND